jgi:hypothetical protein
VVRLLLKHGADVTTENLASVESWFTGRPYRYHTADRNKWKRIAARLRAGLPPAEKTRLAASTAFAMGQHERLGAGSLIKTIPPELARMILDWV